MITLKEQYGYGSKRLGVRKPHVQLAAAPHTAGGYGTMPILNFEFVILNRRAFGSHLPGRTYVAPTGAGYRFGFNGMQRDDEIKGPGNSLDFGARMYDSRLGRWMSVDPLAGKYPDLSPFNFVSNSPLIFIDPDGKRIVLGGNVSMGFNDILTVLPSDNYRASLSVVDNELVFNITEEQALASNDPGVMAIFRLSQSEKVYKLTANPEMKGSNFKGYSKTGDRWYNQAMRDDKGKPIRYDKVITKSNGKQKTIKAPLMQRVSTQPQPNDPSVDYEREYGPGLGGNDFTKTELVFHELLEMYFEGEQGLPYSTNSQMYEGPITGSGAHNSAINVLENLSITDIRKGKTMEATGWRMSLRALNVIKLNRIVLISCNALALCLFGCGMFSKSIITSGGDSPLTCFMNLERTEGVIARITILNISNRPIYIDERYVQGQICYSGIRKNVDSCVVKGIDPIDPPLMIKPKFIKLQSKEKFVFSFENKGELAQNISMKVRIPFFLSDSVFTKIYQNELNSSVFLEANILTIEWQDVAKSGRYLMNPYSFILFSERGW